MPSSELDEQFHKIGWVSDEVILPLTECSLSIDG